MFRNIVLSAAGAGLAVCVAMTLVQAFTTEPLILHAETFEGEAAHDHAADHAAAPAAAPAEEAHDHAGHDHDAAAWSPADGVERTAFTALANLVIGVGVALILLSLMAIRGEPIDARRGLLWGIGGFLAVSLLPALGLPPELPGTPAADLFPRQAWWLATAVASGIGLALIVFPAQAGWKVLGLVLIVLPHVIGAPLPPSHDVAYPGALAGEFVVASLVVSALLWALAGVSAGWLHQKLARPG